MTDAMVGPARQARALRRVAPMVAEQAALIQCTKSKIPNPSMRTPNFAERISMANTAKKAQLERAKRLAEDPQRVERLKAREEIIAARNHRIAEREVPTSSAGAGGGGVGHQASS